MCVCVAGGGGGSVSFDPGTCGGEWGALIIRPLHKIGDGRCYLCCSVALW